MKYTVASAPQNSNTVGMLFDSHRGLMVHKKLCKIGLQTKSCCCTVRDQLFYKKKEKRKFHSLTWE